MPSARATDLLDDAVDRVPILHTQLRQSMGMGHMQGRVLGDRHQITKQEHPCGGVAPPCISIQVHVRAKGHAKRMVRAPSPLAYSPRCLTLP